jgi:hypothetical protein
LTAAGKTFCETVGPNCGSGQAVARRLKIATAEAPVRGLYWQPGLLKT